jgi:hypothetical protein
VPLPSNCVLPSRGCRRLNLNHHSSPPLYWGDCGLRQPISLFSTPRSLSGPSHTSHRPFVLLPTPWSASTLDLGRSASPDQRCPPAPRPSRPRANSLRPRPRPITLKLLQTTRFRKDHWARGALGRPLSRVKPLRVAGTSPSGNNTNSRNGHD